MSVWDVVVGQPEAVGRLQRAVGNPVHAYLFVGPTGAGKKVAARAFASQLLAGVDDPAQRDVDLAMRGEHPDITEVERAGASISAEQAREIVRTASLAPIEGDRKVLVLNEFHLLRPEGAAILLKTIEEPPPSTVIIVLADFIPNDLITISSRCARIDFRVISDAEIAATLHAEGVGSEQASAVARAANGSITRARLLATDTDLVARRDAFAAVRSQLDGTGATASRLTDELLELIDRAAGPMSERHTAEAAELDERIERYGQRGSGKKQLEERHKRELRRHRTDELLGGLAVIAGVYRDALTADVTGDVDEIAGAVTHIYEAMQSFEFNPNETLLLQALLWGLPAA